MKRQHQQGVTLESSRSRGLFMLHSLRVPPVRDLADSRHCATCRRNLAVMLSSATLMCCGCGFTAGHDDRGTMGGVDGDEIPIMPGIGLGHGHKQVDARGPIHCVGDAWIEVICDGATAEGGDLGFPQRLEGLGFPHLCHRGHQHQRQRYQPNIQSYKFQRYFGDALDDDQQSLTGESGAPSSE